MKTAETITTQLGSKHFNYINGKLSADEVTVGEVSVKGVPISHTPLPLSADLPGWKKRLKDHFKGVKRRKEQEACKENDTKFLTKPDFFKPKTKLIQLFKWWR
jgi:hypothetical protein